ncbi:hypothetical protein WA026_021969 [Henosepilachna vigintioctopunctata]|uniref:SCP domain-containing protein n=1 Tax=Henosepilachna vigintioctopunctata TaxID=420089 RepID=A0AAW1VC49_9CUCU
MERPEVFILLFIVYENIITLEGASKGPTSNYCNIRCKESPNAKHEVCARSYKCNSQKNCTEIEADDKFRKAVLSAHNDARNRIADGTLKSGRFPNSGAKNMHVLSYDLELEYITSCAINTCKTLQYNACYDSERFTVGINFDIVYTKDMSFLWSSAIENFKNQIGNVRSSRYIEEYEFDEDGFRESFIRLAWAETKYIGCSAVMDKSGKTGGIFACSYAPANYRKGSSVYSLAKSSNEIASECKDGKNKKYHALCGQIESTPSDLMWKYYQRKKSSAATGHRMGFCILILMAIVNMNHFLIHVS